MQKHLSSILLPSRGKKNLLHPSRSLLSCEQTSSSSKVPEFNSKNFTKKKTKQKKQTKNNWQIELI